MFFRIGAANETLLTRKSNIRFAGNTARSQAKHASNHAMVIR